MPHGRSGSYKTCRKRREPRTGALGHLRNHSTMRKWAQSPPEGTPTEPFDSKLSFQLVPGNKELPKLPSPHSCYVLVRGLSVAPPASGTRVPVGRPRQVSVMVHASTGRAAASQTSPRYCPPGAGCSDARRMMQTSSSRSGLSATVVTGKPPRGLRKSASVGRMPLVHAF